MICNHWRVIISTALTLVPLFHHAVINQDHYYFLLFPVQYFLWYLCLLPLILDSVNMTFRRAAILVIAWFTSQVMFFVLISCELALTFEKYYILVAPVASVIFCPSSWGHTLLIISNTCLFFFLNFHLILLDC